MPRTIADIIYFVNSLKDNAYPDLVKVGWVNDVEGRIWNEIYKWKIPFDIVRELGVSSYSLPVDFSYIDKVFSDDNEMMLIDYSNKNTTGYYRNINGGIGIYPAPVTTDLVAGLQVIYSAPYERKNLVTDKVFVNSPFDKMYSQYMTAMIDWFNKEYEGYNNGIVLFNESYQEYADWYREKVNTNASTG